MSIFAAGRVLLGVWQPGHSVLLPLVAYNAVMGGVYVVAALRIRRDPVRGRQAAAGVALLNLGVLLLLIARAAAGGMVPHESVVAMSLRTAAWLVIVMLTAHVMRASAHAMRQQ